MKTSDQFLSMFCLIRMTNAQPLMINMNGYEPDLRARKYTSEETEALKDSVYESAVAFLKDTAGLGEPDEFRYDDEYEADPSQTVALHLSFRYGDRNAYIRMRLEDKKVMTFIIH